jgi:hypothetical protein
MASYFRRRDEEAPIIVDLNDDRWTLDLNLHNIITKISKDETWTEWLRNTLNDKKDSNASTEDPSENAGSSATPPRWNKRHETDKDYRATALISLCSSEYTWTSSERSLFITR